MPLKESELMGMTGFPAHMGPPEVLSRCPWMVPAIRYGG